MNKLSEENVGLSVVDYVLLERSHFIHIHGRFLQDVPVFFILGRCSKISIVEILVDDLLFS